MFGCGTAGNVSLLVYCARACFYFAMFVCLESVRVCGGWNWVGVAF